MLDVLRKKCDFKGIPVPTVTSLDPAATELIADWDVMLRHQLPVLPPFDSFWAVLPDFFMWLQRGAARTVLTSAPLRADENLFRPAVGLLRREGVRGSSFLETIRFAGANRLCVDLTYRSQDGRTDVRRIEPYSLRRSRADDILLFALRSSDGQSRSYRLDRILGAVMTNQSFVPRFEIELTPADPGPIPSLGRGGTFTVTGRIKTSRCERPASAPQDHHGAPRPARPTFISAACARRNSGTPSKTRILGRTRPPAAGNAREAPAFSLRRNIELWNYTHDEKGDILLQLSITRFKPPAFAGQL